MNKAFSMFTYLVSMAKVKANIHLSTDCIDGITIHGAIGFTEEMDVGLYHLRTKGPLIYKKTIKRANFINMKA